MKPGYLLAVARSALCVSVFASAALVVDYQNPGDPAFCSVESSCFKVRISEVGDFLAERVDGLVPGLQVPQLALFIFLGMLAFTFFVKTRAHLALFASISALGAACAGYLIYAQAKMKLFCAYCMVVDVAMLVAAAAAIALAALEARRAKQRPDAAAGELARAIDRSTDTHATIAWGVAGAMLTAMPFVWARFPPNPPLPPQLAALQQAGKATVIMFTDFQCPYCRKLHTDTRSVLHGDHVVVHRKMVPLPSHPGALPAALAYTCTPPERQNEVADALYGAEPTELTFDGVRGLLPRLGVLDQATAEQCIGTERTPNPDTLALVLAEKKLFFDELGGSGLPTTYAGGTMVKGAQSDKVIRAVGRTGGADFALPVWSMFALAGLVLLGVLIWTERQAGTPAPAQRKKPADDADDDAKGHDEAGDERS